MTNRQWLIWQLINMGDSQLADYLDCIAMRAYLKAN